MSSMQQPFNAGQSQGQGQAKAEEWMQSTQETAHQARNATSDAAQSAKESAQHGKDQSAGFLQQTGEQVMNMAHGAMDSVKNTLGMNEKK
ncbi:hypothetical protein ACFX13_013102 [Malus domestica]|uniref:Uncharacterized protein n=3 Tax=Maleae TaxID=721813 RepID=A0A498I8F1_MALDO|nr:late embryogenesis abundant protein 1 [Malus domestica]XP_050118954.1 late embryogenesis abundant protein 1-like [Malus sylvestris]KAB2599905.1 late embryogenesis abundant protein 1 [Pyrus ussuriensis x Pyrus communis]RXH78454.1 hypothetical protein DVH24_001972 [Malus domestica]TQD78853.1 hypothetical protein C1H46_035584 [Malus baccata]